mmetsp:Transcript_36384/g.109210  ORF Transcript_36384/g.109210 Transcript_36384/m.109210 type:complete len:423 (-) Transcript_36384:249-1517(-)
MPRIRQRMSRLADVVVVVDLRVSRRRGKVEDELYAPASDDLISALAQVCLPRLLLRPATVFRDADTAAPSAPFERKSKVRGRRRPVLLSPLLPPESSSTAAPPAAAPAFTPGRGTAPRGAVAARLSAALLAASRAPGFLETAEPAAGAARDALGPLGGGERKERKVEIRRGVFFRRIESLELTDLDRVLFDAVRAASFAVAATAVAVAVVVVAGAPAPAAAAPDPLPSLSGGQIIVERGRSDPFLVLAASGGRVVPIAEDDAVRVGARILLGFLLALGHERERVRRPVAAAAADAWSCFLRRLSAGREERPRVREGERGRIRRGAGRRTFRSEGERDGVKRRRLLLRRSDDGETTSVGRRRDDDGRVLREVEQVPGQRRRQSSWGARRLRRVERVRRRERMSPVPAPARGDGRSAAAGSTKE